LALEPFVHGPDPIARSTSPTEPNARRL
jgi:hypothetical protein